MRAALTFLGSFALLGAHAHAQNPAPASPPSAPPAASSTGNLNFDQTRRELQELPDSTKSGNTSPAPLLPPVAGPELPAAQTFSTPPPSTPEQSPTWLADAIRQTELSSRRGTLNRTGEFADDARALREPDPARNPPAGLTPTASSANPLTAYVDRWTRTDSANLNRPGSTSDPLPEATLRQPAPHPTYTPDPLGQPAQFFTPPGQTRPNPYLEAMNLSALPAELPPEGPPAPAPDPASVPIFILPTLGQSKSLLPPKPVPENPIPQPTQELINEQKYFPQLRRF